MNNDFSYINSFFSHIYIISIKRAKERHSKIEEVFNGLNYTFFWGVDDKELDIEKLKQEKVYDEKKAIEKHRYNKPMIKGMIGCSWSHKLVYEDCLKNKYDKVLILEDDTIPVENINLLFKNIVEQLPPDWDLLYLDYNKNTNFGVAQWIKQNMYHIQNSLGLLKWNHLMINNLHAKKYSDSLKTAGYHDFTSAYAINLKTAYILNQLQTPICFWPDHLLAFACSNKLLNAFISIPRLIIQESEINKHSIGSYAEEK